MLVLKLGCTANAPVPCHVLNSWHFILTHFHNVKNEKKNSPVHKERKFLHVLGQISEKSWKTILPTTNTKDRNIWINSLLVKCNLLWHKNLSN